MCKFSRTLYNRQLIKFMRIPVEFVIRFIRYHNRVKQQQQVYFKLNIAYKACAYN